MKFKTVLLALAIVLLTANAAWACYPILNASAQCDPATHKAFISYTATADLEVSNPDIWILVNNIKQTSGSFVSPTYSFSGTVDWPDLSASAVVTAYAAADWGNGYQAGQSASVTLSLPDPTTDPNCFQPALGRFTGGGHQIRVGDVRVTRGFTLHCDILLSNNLEVNWGGNSFHMTEYPSSVTCLDDPLVNPVPPPAPVDTIIGVSAGRYNGVDGYTIEFTFVDAGEPGTSGPDKAALKIYETANPSNVVLNVPLQPITGGNVQAHYDQPHM